TSTDISLVVDGAAALATNRRVGSHRIALNSLDIASIGAGGGSIARVDTGGILHVGPESAGAVPGPACYGQGGTDATVTDANLVLGFLDPGHFRGAAVKRLFEEMEAEALRRLRASFDGPVRAARAVDMRYGEQVFEITVPLDEVDWSAADPLPQIVELFHRRHEALYTYAMPDQESVLVNARVAVSGILEELPQEPDLPAAPPAPPGGERRIYLEDWVLAPVYRFDALAPAQTIAGPAIIESATTTVLLHPGDQARVTPQGWLDIAVPQGQ